MKFFKRNQSKSAHNIQAENADFEFSVNENERRTQSNLSNGRNTSSTIDSLDTDTQTVLLKTFETFYEQESEAMITALEESREEIKNSMLDLFYEQEHFKEELVKASEGRYTFKRKKENLIPLAEHLRRKKGLSRNTNSGTPNEDEINRAEKEAVEKYMRKKERQKQAETNRLAREKTEIEAETQKILTKLNEMDLNKEKERQRQLEKLQAKLKPKPLQKDDQVVATEIMENYQESTIAFERGQKLQLQKFQARLSARKADNRNISLIDI
ncbi:unnamed protein product [Brachionus calyciflorus]|uniref:Uncharacterized protein n=1 Tax=Brachionus calyciflorus TaxID=104777 RepID=A0A813PV83_9BILA|nr:unnamed protein product [Brachionus calyciflorus]